jgi:hypothetical protein
MAREGGTFWMTRSTRASTLSDLKKATPARSRTSVRLALVRSLWNLNSSR